MKCSGETMHSPSVLTASAVARCFFCMVMDSGKGTSSSLSNYQMANNSLLFDCIVDATQLIRENTATFGHHQRHGSTQHLYLQKSTEMKCSGETTHTIIVLIASSLAHCFFCMIMDSGGVFHVLFLEAFGGGSGDTAFISSLNTAMFFAAGPVSGFLVQKLGFRTTTIVGALIGCTGIVSSAFVNSLAMAYLTFGFLGGAGLGLAYIPAVSIIGFHFTTRRPMAFAIASSGCGVGKLIAPYALQYCEETYGWRGAICLIGGLTLNVCVCGVVFSKPQKRRQRDRENISASQSRLNSAQNSGLCQNLSMLKNFRFLSYCANNALFCTGYSTALVHLPAYAQTLGVKETHISAFFSMFGLATIMGKLIFGLIGQIKGVRHSILYTVFFMISGIELTLAPLYLKTFVDFLMFCITFGIFMSVFGATLPNIMVELFDVASLSSAYGYLQIFDMVGFMLGPPIAGWMYDWTSFYPASFYFGGACCILSAIIIIPSNIRKSRPSKMAQSDVLGSHTEQEIS